MTEIAAFTPAAVAHAASLLEAGELVAFPTETVYGLGARVDRPEAVERIYAVKGRPRDKAFIVHVRSAVDAARYTASWPPVADALAAQYWPGPLTLILPRHPGLSAVVTAGGDTVALRAPAHPAALALLAACGVGIAAPSANRSGAPPPTSAEQVLRDLDGLIPLVLDGGQTTVGVPSTIVDLTGSGGARVVREGPISMAELAPLLGAEG